MSIGEPGDTRRYRALRGSDYYEAKAAADAKVHSWDSCLICGRRLEQTRKNWGGYCFECWGETAGGATVADVYRLMHYKLDEGTGAATADDTGNFADGTLNNSPTWTTGKHNMALQFNGTNQYVSLPADILTNSHWGTGATIACWAQMVAWEAVDPNDKLLWFEGCLELQVTVATQKAGFNIYDGAQNWLYSDSALSLATWYHLAGTWDGSNQRLYVDGTLQADTASGIGTPDNDSFSRETWFARGGAGGATYSNCVLDDIRVYNIALTRQQIVGIM